MINMIDELVTALENDLTNLVINYLNSNKDFDLEMENNKLLNTAIEEQNTIVIDYLLSKGVDPEKDNKYILYVLSSFGMLDLLKRFIGMGLKAEANNNAAIIKAIETGNIDVANYLYKIKEVKESLMNRKDDAYLSKEISEFIKMKDISDKLSDF